MEKSIQNTSEDIAFIGAGIATGFALLQLAEELKSDKVQKIVRVRVIDKYPEFFCGIPYGKRSSNSVLLINSLRSFAPEPQRSAFIDWLATNKHGLLSEFLTFGGVQAKKWVSDNKADIDKDEWSDLYVPRFFFGKYISNKVRNTLEDCEKKGLVQITYSVAQVLDMTKKDRGFEIQMGDGTVFSSNSVVLSIGSLPTRKIYDNKLVINQENSLIFNDIYNKDLDSNLELIKEYLSGRKGTTTNVLIIGANASGLETLYKFNDNKEIDEMVSSYTVLSSHGVMPDSMIDPVKQKEFTPAHLQELHVQETTTADQIANAAYKDLEKAKEIDLGAASTVDVIAAEVGPLLGKLDRVEAERFACHHGNNIGRLQRCAGSHYTNVVNNLKKKERLDHLAGRFSNLSTKDNDTTLRLKYTDTKTKEPKELPKDIHLVVNCMGSTDLSSADTPELLKNLISKSYVVPNESNIGIQVNEGFEASENLYIAGPMLAGNVIDGKPLWHLEHCGRIIWTSELLIKKLMENPNVN